MFIYVNGSIIHEHEAKISAYDHGYMYGLGLFETFRVENGHPFLLDDHFQRLHAGLHLLGIEWSMTRDHAVTIISDLLQANHLEHAYVRWNVSAGPGELGLYTGTYIEPTTIIYMKPLPPPKKRTKDAMILSIRRNTPEGSIRLKSHHYLNNVLAKRELGTAINTEGIFLNEAGYLAEGIVSNLFWIKDGSVYTPAISTGILDGVTRQFVLIMLGQLGIPFEVGLFKPNNLLEADAAFITNAIQGIVPLRQCNDKMFEEDNELISHLLKVFHQYRQRLWSRTEWVEGKNE